MKDEKGRPKLAFYKRQRKKGKTDDEIRRLWEAKSAKPEAKSTTP